MFVDAELHKYRSAQAQTINQKADALEKQKSYTCL